MTFLTKMDERTGFVANDVSDQGREFAELYVKATPFPHIVIDDFLPPTILEQCLSEFPKTTGIENASFDRPQERFKTQFNPDTLTDSIKSIFYSFNSRPFIKVVENITGIKGLIPDPYFLGAGFHEITQGGHLSVHTDFNHHKPMNLERRINVLIYLNKNWEDEFGGQLEFWNSEMSECVKSIVPLFNRCVIFNITNSSYHGNPNPVAHPAGINRKSIALYYYTATWSESLREHTTQFKVRRGTADTFDIDVGARELAVDLIPPIMLRGIRSLKKRFTSR